MIPLRWLAIVFLSVTVMLTGRFAVADPGAIIAGTLGIRLGDGTAVHGDWIRVLLTTSAVSIPDWDIPSDLPRIARKDRINDLHLRFFVNVRKRMSDSGFLVATTLTTEDGSFRFAEVPSGDYYVLVTFPAVIAGAKVAWQVPVRVDAAGASVELNQGNAALPIAVK